MDPVDQNNQEKDNQDLAQQYQDILDRYAKDLDQKNSTPTSPELSKPLEPSEPLETTPSIPLEPIETPSPATPEPIETPLSTSPEPIDTPSSSSDISDSSSTNELTNPPTSNLFKYIFYLSLVIFTGVCLTIVYNLYFKVSSSDNNNSIDITPTSTISAVATITPSESVLACNLNDQNYEIGQSFKSADGCNTCTCTEDLNITCTEMSCETPSSATKSAVISEKPQATPTIKQDPLSEAKKYLDAYTKGDWTTVKSLCSDENFNETIATGHNFVKYAITSSKYDTDKNYYHVYINFTDNNGKIYKVIPPNKPLEVLMFKENGGWKALTWYFN